MLLKFTSTLSPSLEGIVKNEEQRNVLHIIHIKPHISSTSIRVRHKHVLERGYVCPCIMSS